MKVLVACEFSGTVRDAFLLKGHDAVSCDLIPSERPGPHIQGDVLDHLAEGWDIMIAHPPCQHLASSGARWFAEKREDGRQQQAIEFFLRIADAKIEKKCIENPVGIMSNFFRKPDQIIQPYQFGHAETKKTCLWLDGLPALLPSEIVEPDFHRKKDGSYYQDSGGKRYSRIHFVSGRMPAEERRKIRSRTYPGIAAAMADQWGGIA
jgi:hypothetical protein